MKLEQIKENALTDERFKNYLAEHSISFEDFEIEDIKTNTTLQSGSSREDYLIFVDEEKITVFYNL